ncbi:universal stress protein [Mycobacterium sp. SVM_VP21]|nr:universal stress protein [Mycobacterium sp. SVM_VP21]
MASNTASAGIVVGVDGSSASRAAVRWGAQEADRRALPLTLVHAASTQLSPLMARRIVFGQHELPHRRVQRIVDDAVDVASDSGRGAVPAQLKAKVVFTDPVDVLADLSRQADLVVVGSSGRRRLRHLLSGSVGAALTPRCQCPLAVIQDDDRARPAPASVPLQVDPTGW